MKKTCPTCYGRGYYESPVLYYGRAECGMCGGFGLDPDSTCAGCGHTLGEHLDEQLTGRRRLRCDYFHAELERP